MITNDLYDSVLINPIRLNANEVYIVTGYATSAMAFRHLTHIQDEHFNCKIKLIIGMTPVDGISKGNHEQFKKLSGEYFPGRFECRYLIKNPPVHTKCYSWFKNSNPICAFTGSANYTQAAFNNYQREGIVEDNPIDCLDYYDILLPETVNCLSPDIGDYITFYNERSYRNRRQALLESEDETNSVAIESAPCVKTSFLDRSGNLPQRSGLNWGQRKGREPNQAYIRLEKSIYSTDFFPLRKNHFILLTDDGKSFNCVRAQDNAKAIETPLNNSLLGVYFRERLGVPFGSLVTLDDLLNYGRTDVSIYKIDEETYYLDFSV